MYFCKMKDEDDILVKWEEVKDFLERKWHDARCKSMKSADQKEFNNVALYSGYAASMKDVIDFIQDKEKWTTNLKDS